jgi:hypothetical protein
VTATELRAALSAYMHRSDPETIANELTAIELARVKLGRTFFPELAAAILPSLPIVAGVGDLPADFGQADNVSTPARGDLLYSTPREWSRYVASRDTLGRYTVAGTKVYTDASLTVVALTYYRAVDPISGAASNWCSTGFPDVWLWAAIAEQHRFVQDFESAAGADSAWHGMAADAMEATRGNKEGGALRMSTRR